MTAWAAFLGIIAVLFFCHNDAAFNAMRLKSTFYMALQRPVWTLCLCWLTYACINGHAGKLLLRFLNSIVPQTFKNQCTTPILNFS